MYKYYYSEEQKQMTGSKLVLVDGEWVEYTTIATSDWFLNFTKIFYSDMSLVAESNELLPTKAKEENTNKWSPYNRTNDKTPKTYEIFVSENNDTIIQFKNELPPFPLHKDINDFISNNSFEIRLNNLKKDIDETLRQGHKDKFIELSEEYKRLVEM